MGMNDHIGKNGFIDLTSPERLAKRLTKGRESCSLVSWLAAQRDTSVTYH
jgi:hypothetical protein